MANEEHLRILKKGVKVWNEWRKENRDIRPDLSYANLSYTDLSKANLQSTDLREAILYKADLQSTNLSEANLSEANLRYADLRSAILREAVLRYSYLREVDLRYADLRYANLRYAFLRYAFLRCAVLREADLREADLREADLREAILRCADLREADLREADLRKADLREVDLRETDLFKADLREADLRETDLFKADLREANLNFVDLSEANLHSAALHKANLNQIKIGYTTLSNIDLSSIKSINDLAFIQHSGPSVISTGTLKQSQGEIPKAFLKNCGLDDWEIESAKLYRPGLTPEQINDITYKVYELRENNPFKFFPVFLSHSHKDKAFTRKLYHALDKRGVRAWLDEKQIKMGDKIIKSVSKGIFLYDKFILICSKSALTSWWIDRELEILLDKEQAFNQGKPENEHINLIIPITIDDYIHEWKGHWKSKIKQYKIGDFSTCLKDKIKFNQQVDKLVEALKVYPKGDSPPTYLGK